MSAVPLKTALPLFGRIFRGQWKFAVAIASVSLLIWLASTVSPFLQKQFIDAINHRELSPVIFWGGIAAMALMSLKLGEQLLAYLGSLMNLRLDVQLKTRFFSHLLNLPVGVLHAGGSGYYGIRFFNDVNVVNQFCSSGFFALGTAVLKTLGAVFFCCLLDWRLGLGVVPVLVLFVVVTWRVSRRQYRLNLELSEQAVGNRRLLQNALDRATLLKAGSREEEMTKRVQSGIEENAFLRRRLLRRENLLQGALQLVPSLCVGITVILGIHLIFADEWTLGDLWAFTGYLLLVFHPARSGCMLFIRALLAIAAANRLNELLVMEPEEGKGSGVIPGRLRGEIEFRSVDFAYPGAERILNHFDLRINAGEFLGLAGDNGSGKSTIASLLLRLNRPDSGQILLDGVPLSDYELGALRRRIGYLDQRTEMLHGSLRDNLQPPGMVLPDSELLEVLNNVGVGDLIRTLPSGLDTDLYENSGNFSGGELLCFAMARELLRKADLYIFDEATANLDIDAERRVVALIRRELRGKTVLFISHRTSTLDAADRVIRMGSC